MLIAMKYKTLYTARGSYWNPSRERSAVGDGITDCTIFEAQPDGTLRSGFFVMLPHDGNIKRVPNQDMFDPNDEYYVEVLSEEPVTWPPPKEQGKDQKGFYWSYQTIMKAAVS